MKKNLLLLAAFIVLVVGSFENVLAQNQTVSVNSEYDYTFARTVTGSTVSFAITGGAGVGGYTLTPADNIATIRWNTASATNYTITVTESNGVAGCLATTTYTVLVTSSTEITFNSASTAAICSGDAFSTQVNFDRSLSASEVPATIPVLVTVGTGAPAAATADLTVSGVAPYSSAMLSITGFNTNASSSNVTKVITLQATTDAQGGTITVGAADEHSLPVNARPTASTITPN